MLKLTMIGNLGNDAEVRDVNGQKVISFNLAHTERYTDRTGQQQERTTWVSCSMWRQDGRTGVADFLKKGKQVYVEGMPSARAYTTRDGQNTATLDLRVMTLELLGGRGEGAPANGGNQGGGYSAPRQQQQQPADNAQRQPQSAPMEPPADSFDDDLPF